MKPKKNPNAVALGRLAKGKPKTMTPAAKKARQHNAQSAAAKRRLAMALHAKDLEPVPPGPAVAWEEDED